MSVISGGATRLEDLNLYLRAFFLGKVVYRVTIDDREVTVLISSVIFKNTVFFWYLISKTTQKYRK